VALGWSPTPDERLEELRRCLERVAEGPYEEIVEPVRNGAKLIGRFRGEGPEPYVRYGNDFGAPRVTTFDPY
jgi:hypothetical protein